MKVTVLRPVRIEVKYVNVNLPVRFDEEDIPNDAPKRQGDTWEALIDIDEGVIVDWPEGKTLDMYMKVCDSGMYTLYGPEMEHICSISDYVPHDLIPGEYGDYVELKVDGTGKILNWPKKIDLRDFFNLDE